MRNSFGILTGWRFPLRNTRAALMPSSPLYLAAYTGGSHRDSANPAETSVAEAVARLVRAYPRLRIECVIADLACRPGHPVCLGRALAGPPAPSGLRVVPLPPVAWRLPMGYGRRDRVPP